MNAPRISINGVALKDDQAMALALAVHDFLDALKDNPALRDKWHGWADDIEADLTAVMAMLERSLAGYNWSWV